MYQDYAKHIGADEYVQKWVATTLKNHLETNKPSTEEVEHILDYLVQSGKRVSKMSYDQAKSNAEKWMKSQIKKGNDIDENPEDTETILDFKDGFRIVRLVGENAYKREGYLMRHCVASYYGRNVEIYSLRDNNNTPHCTIERDQQIKGKGNGDIHPKYVGYVVKFLKHVGMTVGDSEMLHLGYMNVENFKKDFGKETRDKLFDGKYLPKTEKWIGKDGEEFATLDILDQVPLISVTDSSLKVNFELPNFVKLSIDFLFKKSKKCLSTDEDKLASSGDSSQLEASGYYSQLAASGDYSKLAASGNYSKLASSGNHSQLAASGDYSQLASSGYSSQLAASGYHSQLAASGDYSKLAASGDYSQLAVSGNYSKLASSGNHSQLASSGDSSKLAMECEKSVGANIGFNGLIKGKKGCWITLAEYDGNYDPICVKSAQIDGETLKEDTWYGLRGGEFVEGNK